MTHRLLVNPGTPQAWEIQLKSGANRIGRREANDFQVPHVSVSGTHCEIVVSSAGAILKDLGSTNGTFVNGVLIHEAILQSGQHLQLGSVDMVFESAPIAAVATAASAVPPLPPPVTARVTGLRFSGAAAPAAHAPVATPVPVEEEPALAPTVAAPAGGLSAGVAYCKSHAKTPARFYCNKCRKYFCDLCVGTHATTAGPKKTCRACGAEVAPVHVHVTRPVTRGFFASLPAAFSYPFRGFGIIILLLAAGIFGGVNYLGSLGFLRGPSFLWIVIVAVYGLMFLFLQNIIHTTTADENESLGFPEAGGLFGAAFQLFTTILVSFAPLLAMGAAGIFFEVEVPAAAYIGGIILGCLYCPMAFLAVAMKDSVLAANPLVVIPTILRLPGEYLVTAILLIAVFGIRQLGNSLSSVAGDVSLSTKDMTTLFVVLAIQAGISFLNVYLLTVMMRILGLLYNHKKEQFGWFSH